jgi:hypothetical protein
MLSFQKCGDVKWKSLRYAGIIFSDSTLLTAYVAPEFSGYDLEAKRQALAKANISAVRERIPGLRIAITSSDWSYFETENALG